MDRVDGNGGDTSLLGPFLGGLQSKIRPPGGLPSAAGASLGLVLYCTTMYRRSIGAALGGSLAHRPPSWELER